MKLNPIFAVVHQVKGSNPELLPNTVSESHEYCCTKFDQARFSADPEDRVYMVELGYCDVIETNRNTG